MSTFTITFYSKIKICIYHVTNEILQKLRVEGFRKIYLKKNNDVTALAVALSFAGLVLAHGKHLYRLLLA